MMNNESTSDLVDFFFRGEIVSRKQDQVSVSGEASFFVKNPIDIGIKQLYNLEK